MKHILLDSETLLQNITIIFYWWLLLFPYDRVSKEVWGHLISWNWHVY